MCWRRAPRSALWLLLAGPKALLGIDTGKLGFAMLETTAWVILYALYRVPRGDLDAAISPGEWRAWIGLVFMAQVIGYLLARFHVFSGPPLLENPAARAVGTHVVMLVVAWSILSRVLAARWAGKVQEDERDREIAVRASGWGRGVLVFCVIGLAVLFAFSGEARLAWATPLVTAHLLVFALLWGALVEYAASAAMYWRDRY
ncbi:MAG: hypothetical protein ACR2J7_02255 [Luteimonas sp.]